MGGVVEYREFLSAISPSSVTDDGQVAVSTVGTALVAVWRNAGGSVTVAGYRLADSRCLHMWTGPCSFQGAVAASTALRAEGLGLRLPTRPPSEPGLEDLMDLFG